MTINYGSRDIMDERYIFNQSYEPGCPSPHEMRLSRLPKDDFYLNAEDLRSINEHEEQMKKQSDNKK